MVWKAENPSADRLRELFFYCKDTGVFTRRTPTERSGVGTVVGTKDGAGYLVVSVDGKVYRLHQLAVAHVTGSWPTAPVDHKNRRKSDNRWGNLRMSSKSENGQNQVNAPSSNRSCGVLGVSKGRSNCKAGIRVNGRRIHLGTFATVEQAREAYLSAKRILHPAFYEGAL